MTMLLRPASARIPRPPGPSSASLLTAVALGGQHLTTFFDRAARRHPRIAHLRLGPEHVYLLNSPDLVHEVLVRQARSTMKGRAIQATRQLLGNGTPDVPPTAPAGVLVATHHDVRRGHADAHTRAQRRLGARVAHRRHVGADVDTDAADRGPRAVRP